MAFWPSKILERPPEELTAAQIICWWETRRLIFNVAVGLTGLGTCVVVLATGEIMEARGYAAIGIPDPPIFAVIGIILYGAMANLCYTLGWASELVARRIWPKESSSYGKITFATGLAGSILLTLLPVILTIVVAISVAIAGHPKSH